VADWGSSQYQFRLSHRGDGTFWIYFEPLGEEIELLEDVFFGIDLPAGITIQRAREIAAYLNQNLGALHFTRVSGTEKEGRAASQLSIPVVLGSACESACRNDATKLKKLPLSNSPGNLPVDDP
jgi:hypothetical protein